MNPQTKISPERYGDSDAQYKAFCAAKAVFEDIRPIPTLYFIVSALVLSIIGITVFAMKGASASGLLWLIVAVCVICGLLAADSLRTQRRIDALAELVYLGQNWLR